MRGKGTGLASFHKWKVDASGPRMTVVLRFADYGLCSQVIFPVDTRPIGSSVVLAIQRSERRDVPAVATTEMPSNRLQ